MVRILTLFSPMTEAGNGLCNAVWLVGETGPEPEWLASSLITSQFLSRVVLFEDYPRMY